MDERPFGNNKVVFRRLLAGPDAKSAIVTCCLILVPSILYFIFVAPYYVKNVSVGVIIIPIVVFITTLGLFLKTVFTDPGIIPRRPDARNTYDYILQQRRDKPPPRYQDVVINGYQVKLKYCVTCSIYRPPRTTHCSICENCVERFDHHCPWVGNCIGKRNYRSFIFFVVSVGILTSYVCVTTFVQIALVVGDKRSADSALTGSSALWKALEANPVSAVLAVFTFIMLFFPMGLCAYHVYLVMTNQTTYEQIKALHHYNGGNPFYRGKLGNIIQEVVGSIRRSYIDVPACGILPVPTIPADDIGLGPYSQQQQFPDSRYLSDVPVEFESNPKPPAAHNTSASL